MIQQNLDFTICSTNPECYNRISTKLPAPITYYSKIVVTNLTSNCDIVVLNSDDYIMINGIQYSLREDYTNLNRETIVSYMQQLLNTEDMNDIAIKLDNAGRVYFQSNHSFYIDRMTYNFTILLGFYNMKFPIYSSKSMESEDIDEFIVANSTGFTLSTPILYLLSNVGFQSYRNNSDVSLYDDNNSSTNSIRTKLAHSDNNISGARIVMRINNAFSANMPIIVNNGDYVFTVPSNDLSMLEFTLVDAYLHEVKLLSPIYISINITSVPDEVVYPAILNEQK